MAKATRKKIIVAKHIGIAHFRVLVNKEETMVNHAVIVAKETKAITVDRRGMAAGLLLTNASFMRSAAEVKIN